MASTINYDDDKKRKYQSCEFNINIDSDSTANGHFNTMLTAYGQDKEEATENSILLIDDLISQLIKIKTVTLKEHNNINE